MSLFSSRPSNGFSYYCEENLKSLPCLLRSIGPDTSLTVALLPSPSLYILQPHQPPGCFFYSKGRYNLSLRSLYSKQKDKLSEAKLPKAMLLRSNRARIQNQVSLPTCSASFYSTPLHKGLMTAWLLSNRFSGGHQSVLRKDCSAFLWEPQVLLWEKTRSSRISVCQNR